MSLKSGGNPVDNYNLKFLELKKYLISESGNSGLNSISMDNSEQNIFVINDNNLVVIQLNGLLSFEWNKSVVNEICHQFQHFSIALNFKPHLISISGKGFGNKLAVCGTDPQNESTFIVFFDLKDIYKNHIKSSAFTRINLINSFGLVTDIVWHSEFSDNQLGCCLSDGSLFIISIGDIETKTTSILSHLSSASNSLSLCWSPKGKQLVVGHKSGYFSQYKLINGQPLQEVKRTHLINNLNEYNVIAIKWIVSSLFVIAITKDLSATEKDTHILLVSTPNKTTPQFIDFGSLCFDNFESQFMYKINLMHLNNIILCSTSLSSEVTVLGCDSNKEIAVPENWCHWTLEDSSRIDLPMDRDGNETYFRGMAISRGTQNVYKLSVNETYGGPDCPLLFVYNSSGVLIPYLMIDRSGYINKIMPPIVKTSVTVSPSTPQMKPFTSTPIVSANMGHSISLSTVTTSSSVSPLTPVVSSQIFQNKVISATSQTFKPSVPSTLTSVNSQSSAISDIKSAETTSQPTDSLTINQKTANVANELYINAIKEQLIEFNKVLVQTKKKYSKINSKIGQKEEQNKLRNDSRLLEEVLKELNDNFKSCSKDTTTLQSSLIESFSLLEEAKSIMDKNVDPKYRNLLKQRALDPITARRMQEIHNLNEYIEIQLRELDAKFEQEWYEWLQKRKTFKLKQTNKIQSNNSLELIYKSLANNQRVINALKLQLDLLEDTSNTSPLQSKTRFLKVNQKEKQIIDKLAQTLSKNSIKDISEDINIEKPFKLKTISLQKKNSLREFFDNRTKVPIRRSVDNSSRFISAIEKLKQKSLSLSSDVCPNVTTIPNNVNNELNQIKSQTIIKSMDNKVNITPTFVNKINDQKVESKIVREKPLNRMELESKSTPSPVLSKAFSKVDPLSTPLKIGVTKPIEIFGNSSTKPITFSLNSNQLTGAQKSFTTGSIAQNQNLTFTQKTPSITSKVETDIPPKTKLDSSKKSELESEIPSTSKSVSFGNTTIINPIETTSEEDFKLDTITELSESVENTSTTNSPFTTFKRFGGFGSNESTVSKLSFNLNEPKPNFSFNSTANSIKTNESLPKYEDISPPMTPQKEKTEIVVTSVPTETQPSKELSIPKTIQTNSEQKEIKEKEPSILRSLITDETEADSTTSTSTVSTSFSVGPTTQSTTTNLITFSSPTLSQTTSQPLNNNIISSKPVTEQSSQKTEQINSPFSGTPSFGTIPQNTPFASNSFSFGNIPSSVSTNPPPFGEGKGLTSFGFGTANQNTAVSNPTTNSNALSFGQQTSNLNSLSFCGLGGRPNPENAQKNVFSGGFSSPPLQTSLSFNTSPQSSTFNIKTTTGGPFSGSFSSGSAGVAQTGFAAFGSTSPSHQSPQQIQPVFGTPLPFGAPQQPAFGSSPTFGGSPTQSAFGIVPTFGGAPVLGTMNAFGSQSTPGFGSNIPFSGSANTGLSFGALASSAPQQQQNTTPFNSNFSFGNTDNFSFTQRRK